MAEENQAPTAQEVLSAIAESLDSGVESFERIVVMQASPHEYAYRLYASQGDDYEGGVMRFD